MRISTRLLSSSARQPLIKFVGKRSWPSGPEKPHSHPAAPQELKQRFDEIFNRSSSSQSKPSSSSSSSSREVLDFWDTPNRFMFPRIRNVNDEEIEAVLTGGASMH